MSADVVLIVEDNPKNMKLARDVLQFHGFATLEAVTGADAVHVVSRQVPDVILMDIQLPDMDGTDALRQLRANPATASIPVVAMTAFAMREDRERLLAAGFDAYVSKPIDIKEFPRVVRSFCPAAGASGGRG
jgi:two-component system cell cycle response regulator DivK